MYILITFKNCYDIYIYLLINCNTASEPLYGKCINNYFVIKNKSQLVHCNDSNILFFRYSHMYRNK